MSQNYTLTHTPDSLPVTGSIADSLTPHKFHSVYSKEKPIDFLSFRISVILKPTSIFSKLRHHEILTTIFHGSIPEQDSNIYTQFEVEHRKLQQSRSTLERQVQDIRQELSGKEEKRRLLSDELKRKDALRNEYTDRLHEQLNGQVYEEYLEKLSTDVKQKQDEKGNIIGMEKTYQKFVSQVRSTLKTDP